MASVNLGKVTVTPKGDWSNSTAYEKLDIVSDGGSAYLAKKAVPAGTALTNTSYWQVLVIPSREPFIINGTIYRGAGATFTDARINDEYWMPVRIQYAYPNRVMGDVTWETDATNHTITLTGKGDFTNTTEVAITMIHTQA